MPKISGNLESFTWPWWLTLKMKVKQICIWSFVICVSILTFLRTEISKMLNLIISIIIYFQNAHFFPTQLGLDVCPYTRPLHISLNPAHLGCKPSPSVSSFTHYLHVLQLLPPPHHISTGLHQIISFLTFHMPNHLNLPRLTTFATLNTQQIPFLSFRDTSHIHITIMLSALSRHHII